MSVPTTAIANIQAAGSRLLRTPLAARASRAMAPISPTLLRNDRSRTVAYPNEVGSPVIAISIGDQGRRVKSVSTCPHPRSGRGESVDCPLSKTVAEDELRLPRLKAVRRLLDPGESERLASRHCYDRRSSNSGWDTGGRYDRMSVGSRSAGKGTSCGGAPASSSQDANASPSRP